MFYLSYSAGKPPTFLKEKVWQQSEWAVANEIVAKPHYGKLARPRKTTADSIDTVWIKKKHAKYSG
jgi:hypothetical protein